MLREPVPESVPSLLMRKFRNEILRGFTVVFEVRSKPVL